MELMMRYELKIGNRFLFIKDEVADIRCICSAIRCFLLGYSMRSKSFKLKLAKILPFISQATGAVVGNKECGVLAFEAALFDIVRET